MNKLTYKLRTLGYPLALLLALQPVSYAQQLAMGEHMHRVERTSTTEPNRKLKDVLNDLRSRYQVDILFADQMVEDHSVPADAINPDAKLEKNLEAILKPLGLRYKKAKDGTYLITRKEADKKASVDTAEDTAPNATATTDFMPQTANMGSEQGHINLVAMQVKGKVTDEQGNGLPGVSVLLKGTTTGTATDVNGAYALNVPDGTGTLVFSFIGFLPQEVAITNQTTIDVKLLTDVKSLTEVVVVGYGEQKKVTLTGAVSTVKGAELQKSPAVNLSNSIAGRMSGVIAMNSSGEPGYDGSSIRIRGSNTLGNNDALIVIDGVPARAGGFDRINPQDIESISVLKDASAAIYGSRAANGVILITTKHGKSGKPQLSYSFNYGWAQPTVLPKMASASQYAELVNEIDVYKLPSSEWAAASKAFKETGSYTRPNGNVANATFKPDDFKKFNDGSDPWGHPNTDWFGAVLKDWSPQSKHSLQISGGSENVKYLGSLGYQNQDGYYKNSATGYKQYDFRLNVDAKVNKYINTTIGVTGRQENRFFPTQSAGSIFRMLMRGYPYAPAIWPNGKPGPDIENGQQPVVITTNETGYDKDTRYYLQTNGKVEVAIPGIEGLKVTGSAAVDKYLQQGKTWQKPWFIYSWDKTSYEADGVTPKLTKVQKGPNSQATLNQYTTDQLNILLQGLISYDHKFGDHAITILAGITKETSNQSYFNAFRKYFNSTAIDQLFAGGSSEKNSNGSAWERARLSYFGRVGYNFREKYLAEFLWRRDGSYMFPANSRWGFFPGVTAGWRISEEGFFKQNINFITNLKLRASWGQLGNDQVYFGGVLREYDYLPTYGFGGNGYVTNNQVSQTLYENGVPNTNLTWEVANNSDIGLEGALLNGKLFFEFDVFQNKRSQILWRRNASIPQTTGMTLPAENIGKVSNKGWDFKVGYDDQVGDLHYNVTVNGGYAKNKIVFWDETPGAPDWQKSTGHPMNTGLYYQANGIYSTQADIDADISPVTGKPLDYSGVGASTLRPGDMKFKDIGGPLDGPTKGGPDGKINGFDQVRSDKNNQPRFQGGLNIGMQYKGFDLTVLFQGSAGGQIFLQTESGTIGNFLAWSYDNRWTVDNPSTTAPRTVDRNNQYFNNGNTYWLKNTDYIRLKNLELGYNLPEKWVKKAGMSNLRVYVNGLNLVTWDKTDIFDPESVSGSLQYYPQSRVINTGLTVTF
jgi:TonB-dependent starch-binding outer membrane protein SusC